MGIALLTASECAGRWSKKILHQIEHIILMTAVKDIQKYAENQSIQLPSKQHHLFSSLSSQNFLIQASVI